MLAPHRRAEIVVTMVTVAADLAPTEVNGDVEKSCMRAKTVYMRRMMRRRGRRGSENGGDGGVACAWGW